MIKSDIRQILGLDLPPVAKLAIIACMAGAGKHEIEKYYSIQKLIDSEIIERKKTRYVLTPKFCEVLGLDHALPIELDTPDSRVREAVEEYRNLYNERWEIDPAQYWRQSDWGKNSKLIKDLLAMLDKDFPDRNESLLFLKRALRAYIYDEDDFLHKAGYTLVLFYSRFQAYLLQLKKTRANQERLGKKYNVDLKSEPGLSWLEEKKIEEKRLNRPSTPNTGLIPIGPTIRAMAKKFGLDLKLITGEAVSEPETASDRLGRLSSPSALKPPEDSGTI